MGGQSAFGTKAGDLFTKITIFVAAFWILMCVATVKWATVTTESSPFGKNLGTQAGPAVVPGGADGKDSAKDSDKTPPNSPPKTPPAEDNASGSDSKGPAEKK
jgi:preprotein translocase subunit SecG